MASFLRCCCCRQEFLFALFCSWLCHYWGLCLWCCVSVSTFLDLAPLTLFVEAFRMLVGVRCCGGEDGSCLFCCRCCLLLRVLQAVAGDHAAAVGATVTISLEQLIAIAALVCCCCSAVRDDCCCCCWSSSLIVFLRMRWIVVLSSSSLLSSLMPSPYLLFPASNNNNLLQLHDCIPSNVVRPRDAGFNTGLLRRLLRVAQKVFLPCSYFFSPQQCQVRPQFFEVGDEAHKNGFSEDAYFIGKVSEPIATTMLIVNRDDVSRQPQANDNPGHQFYRRGQEQNPTLLIVMDISREFWQGKRKVCPHESCQPASLHCHDGHYGIVHGKQI